MNGLEIAKIRKEMGMNVREFAELVKMDRRSVANWESGKAKIPDSKMVLIDFLLKEFRNNTPKQAEVVEVVNPQSIENLNREVLDLKDHIQTLKDMLSMVKSENVFLKEKLDNFGNESSG